MPWSREFAQLPTPTIATRTLSLEGVLPFDFPFVEDMDSFPVEPSRSLSVPTMSSFTFCRRSAARLTSRSFSSGGMRSSTDPPSRSGEPARPLGSNGTAKPAARWPTATSLKLRRVDLASSTSRRLSAAGMRTKTFLRRGASTTVLATITGVLAGGSEAAVVVAGHLVDEALAARFEDRDGLIGAPAEHESVVGPREGRIVVRGRDGHDRLERRRAHGRDARRRRDRRRSADELGPDREVSVPVRQPRKVREGQVHGGGEGRLLGHVPTHLPVAGEQI